ncbi:MAG: nucleoside hydrolase [Gammaproteobacteria bacterium]|nr:nucleoside hydrolase [Gammaproteobacteria bacterium]
MSGAIPLIIDTDVALGIEHDGRPRDIDDAFALVESINADDIDLLGVTCVYGNAPHEFVYQVARDIVTLKEADIPVLPGADRALPAAGTLPPPNEAVEFLASTLRAGPAHIAAIGPLTNLGLLAHHHPDVLGNVASVIAVAGRSEDAPFYLGEAGPVRDFNFENDVRAARLLLEAGVPVVLAGFELTSQVAVTADDLEAIRRVGTATADYFHRNSLAWCSYWTRTFPVDAGFHPWDSAAIAWLRHPEYFVTEQRGWRIQEVGAVGATSGSRLESRSYSRSYWLECDPDYPGDRVTYCTGFAPGGREAFVRDVVTTVY